MSEELVTPEYHSDIQKLGIHLENAIGLDLKKSTISEYLLQERPRFQMTVSIDDEEVSRVATEGSNERIFNASTIKPAYFVQVVEELREKGILQGNESDFDMKFTTPKGIQDVLIKNFTDSSAKNVTAQEIQFDDTFLQLLWNKVDLKTDDVTEQIENTEFSLRELSDELLGPSSNYALSALVELGASMIEQDTVKFKDRIEFRINRMIELENGDGILLNGSTKGVNEYFQNTSEFSQLVTSTRISFDILNEWGLDSALSYTSDTLEAAQEGNYDHEIKNIIKFSKNSRLREIVDTISEKSGMLINFAESTFESTFKPTNKLISTIIDEVETYSLTQNLSTVCRMKLNDGRVLDIAYSFSMPYISQTDDEEVGRAREMSKIVSYNLEKFLIELLKVA